MRKIPAAIGLLAICFAAVTASAQNYPTRPIRMIIPQPAGGTMDTNARALSEPLARELGQNIVIDNRSGANGIIAGEMLAKAPPDGYTLLFTSSSLIYNQVINKKVPFDALRDFIPITQMAQTFGYLVLANPQTGATSIRELVELSKKRQVAYGSGGIGNSQHFLGELINIRAGAKLVHVPYKGLAPLIAATISNEVQVGFATPLTVIQHVKGGRLRALAYTGDKRWSGMPELPTMAEAGVADCVFEPGGHGIYAPAGTPVATVNRIHAAVVASLKTQKMLDHLATGGYVAIGSTPAEFRRYLEGDLKRIGEIARLAKIEAQQ
jgi:tripartite-type tricarboxylate transporter receptor subunit TctC